MLDEKQPSITFNTMFFDPCFNHNPTLQSRRCLPCDAVFIDGDGVRARAFTHAIQLFQRDVQAHEVIQSVFGNRCSSSAAYSAAVQAQSSTHLLEDQIISQHEAPRHLILSVTHKINQYFIKIIEDLFCLGIMNLTKLKI